MALAYPSFRTVEPLSPYLPENLRQGLVLYLWMNEGSGNRVYDLSGNGNHATIYGATWTRLASGKNALYFDGVDDYVRVYDTLGIPASSSFTFEVLAFLRSPVTSQNQYFIAKHDRAAIRGHYMGTPNLGMIWFYSDGSAVEWNSGRNIVGSWSHLAMVYDSSAQKMYLYLNGTEISGGRPVTKPLREGYHYYVGAWTYDYGFIPATISVARIYNRALSDAEIRTLYDLHRGLFAG